jgi:hypothetical protein
VETRIIDLPDGRELAFALAGDENGTPVFAFHGTPGSRHQLLLPFVDELARHVGVRLVVPDRPGYGHSSFRPGRRLADWPVDGRAALGHAPWEEHEGKTSDVATWLRFDDPPRLADGALDPLAVMTLADRMPGAVSERIVGERMFAPSADLMVHLFAPRARHGSSRTTGRVGPETVGLQPRAPSGARTAPSWPMPRS